MPELPLVKKLDTAAAAAIRTIFGLKTTGSLIFNIPELQKNNPYWTIYNRFISKDDVKNIFDISNHVFILPEISFKIGHKLVYIKLEEKQTVFELYQLTSPGIAEKLDEFHVSALLDKQLTVFTDFDVILFALGITEKESYLLLPKTEAFLFKNVVEKHGDKFVDHLCLESQEWEKPFSEFEFIPKVIKLCKKNIAKFDLCRSLSQNYQNPFIRPKLVKNYESQTNLMGIDLGTTHLCLAVSRNNRIDVIPIDKSGNLWAPSVVRFGEDDVVIGQVAMNGLKNEPDSVIYFPKLLPFHGIGHSFGCILGSMIQLQINEANFYVKSDNRIQKISLTDVVARLMKTIQTAASDYQSGFNETKKMNQAVLTVPQWRSGLLASTYEFLWSEAIIQAGLKLGIEILDIIPEVYADLLYYLSKYDVGKNQNILVIDCGGGRTACQGYQIIKDGDRERIIHLSLSAEKEWESMYSADVFGGVHFESKIVHKMNKIFLEDFKINPMETKKSKYNFFKTIQKIKHITTQENEERIEMSEFDPKLENTTFVVEKTMFDDMFNEEIVERYQEMLLQWKEKYDFDVIFLAGGTNRIPILQEIVKKEFPNGKIIMDGQVEIITATGAAIHGLQLLNGDCVPLSSFTRFNANDFGGKYMRSHISAATSEENEIEKMRRKANSLKVENPKLFIKKIEMIPHKKI